MKCPFSEGDILVSERSNDESVSPSWQIYRVLEIYEEGNTLDMDIQSLGSDEVSTHTITFEECCIKTELLQSEIGYQWEKGTAYFWDGGLNILKKHPYPLQVLRTEV
jgi:hypothetical protein